MAERETVIDYTIPYYEMVGLTILMHLPSTPSSLFRFLTVLETNVWLCILAAFFFTGSISFSIQSNRIDSTLSCEFLTRGFSNAAFWCGYSTATVHVVTEWIRKITLTMNWDGHSSWKNVSGSVWPLWRHKAVARDPKVKTAPFDVSTWIQINHFFFSRFVWHSCRGYLVAVWVINSILYSDHSRTH